MHAYKKLGLIKKLKFTLCRNKLSKMYVNCKANTRICFYGMGWLTTLYKMHINNTNIVPYYRPPEGYESCKWLCVSANLLCLEKKKTANHAAAISHKLRWRNSTVSVKAETAECLVARDSVKLSRDAYEYIKESRLFMYTLNNSDKLFWFR